LSSNSAIILQAGKSRIVLNSTGVFIDGPAVVLNGGTSLGGYEGPGFDHAVVEEPELELPPGRDPVSPAVADDSKSGFASSTNAAKQTPPKPNANGASKGPTGG
jgi:hypothetical protein